MLPKQILGNGWVCASQQVVKTLTEGLRFPVMQESMLETVKSAASTATQLVF